MDEIWKDIKDYEGIYQISNFGIVKSLKRKVNHRRGIRSVNESILKQQKLNNGYLTVPLSKNNSYKLHYIHRLIAIAFIQNPENKPEVDHINTKRDDNNIQNLRWVDRKGNMNNKMSIQKISTSSKGKYNKIRVSKQVLQIDKRTNEQIQAYKSMREAERQTGIPQQSISKVCNGLMKSTHGFKWTLI